MSLGRLETRASRTLRSVLCRTGVSRKKVFAVGFNKTGTSSLHALFESLGRPSYHGTEWRSGEDHALLGAYECFSDGIPKDFTRLDRMFPGSKFIMQVRELDTWVYSRLAHIERTKAANTYDGDATWDTTRHAVEAWITQRNAHHLDVLSYFSGRPADLLVVNFIRDASASTKICRFLGAAELHRKPRENVNPNKVHPDRHVELLKGALAKLSIPEGETAYDIYCPSIADADLRSRFPHDSSVLDQEPRSNDAD